MTRRVALGAQFLVAAVLGVVVMAAAPGSTADDKIEQPVPLQVVLDKFTPLIPEQGDTIRIIGHVTNASREPIDDVTIGLRKSSAPLKSRGDIATVLQAEVQPPGGSPDDVELPATASPIADRLAPGERRRFAIRISMDALGLPEPGTYVLGIEGRGALGSSAATRLADVRTFLPWYPADSVEPVDLAWLWPLADWPARTASGVLLDQRTPEELAPKGRLSRLVDIGSANGDLVSWIADPALLQTASDMSSGYLVEVDGRPVPGTGEQDAKSWLERVSRATGEGARLRTLPYADVDASAVTRAGLSTDVVRAVTTGPVIAAEALGSPTRGGLYWAPIGRIDRASLNVLASAGVTDIVLGSQTLPPTNPQTDLTGVPTASVPTSVGTMRAVLADSELTAILSVPSMSVSDSLLARQLFLAHTALVAQTLPPTSTSRTLIAAPASVRWDPSTDLASALLRATRSAPWLDSTTLEEVLATPLVPASRQRGGYGDKARESELTDVYMTEVQSVSNQLDGFTAVIDDPTGIVEPYSAALLRSESSAWRTRPGIGRQLVDSIGDELSTQTGRIRVLSAETITFSGDTGRVPVSIANDLDRSVTVGLALKGVPAARLSSEPLTGIQIEPGKMASVDIDARVIGGDPLAVDISLTTPEGEVFTTPTRTVLTSTAYARAAAWVVAAAFIAIVVFVIVGVARRIHAARTSRSAGTDDDAAG